MTDHTNAVDRRAAALAASLEDALDALPPAGEEVDGGYAARSPETPPPMASR